MMKRFLHTFREVGWQLNVAFLTSVVLILCIEFWWSHQPAMFGWQDAPKAAELAKDFLLSIVASYIFFFIGDHWQRLRDKARHESSVFVRLATILAAYNIVVLRISEARVHRPSKRAMRQMEPEEMRDLFTDLYWANNGSVARFMETWTSYVNTLSGPAATIIDEFGDFDSELTRILDNLRTEGAGLVRQSTSSPMPSVTESEDAYRKRTRHYYPPEVGEIPPWLWRLFLASNELVDYVHSSATQSNHAAKVNAFACMSFLNGGAGPPEGDDEENEEEDRNE